MLASYVLDPVLMQLPYLKRMGTSSSSASALGQGSSITAEGFDLRESLARGLMGVVGDARRTTMMLAATPQQHPAGTTVMLLACAVVGAGGASAISGVVTIVGKSTVGSVGMVAVVGVGTVAVRVVAVMGEGAIAVMGVVAVMGEGAITVMGVVAVSTVGGVLTMASAEEATVARVVVLAGRVDNAVCVGSVDTSVVAVVDVGAVDVAGMVAVVGAGAVAVGAIAAGVVTVGVVRGVLTVASAMEATAMGAATASVVSVMGMGAVDVSMVAIVGMGPVDVSVVSIMRVGAVDVGVVATGGAVLAVLLTVGAAGHLPACRGTQQRRGQEGDQQHQLGRRASFHLERVHMQTCAWSGWVGGAEGRLAQIEDLGASEKVRTQASTYVRRNRRS